MWIEKNELYKKLKEFNLKDAVHLEEKDIQFVALKQLYENKNMSDSNYLFLIIANSLICYQLSWKWENYWEEFSKILENKNFKNFEEIYIFFKFFLPESKNNKRFIETKLKRVKKIENFYKDFIWKEKHYYENMLGLRDVLAKTMNQKNDAKTIVFAIKMFNYWARNIFSFVKNPDNISIPIDSRLEKLFEKYNSDYDNSCIFFYNLSKKLNISPLHLDAILWVNYDEYIK